MAGTSMDSDKCDSVKSDSDFGLIMVVNDEFFKRDILK